MFLRAKVLVVMITIVAAPYILFARESLDYISIETFKTAISLLAQKEFKCKYTNGGVEEINIRGRVRAVFSSNDKSFYAEIYLAPNKKTQVYFDSTNYNKPPAWAANWPEYFKYRKSLVYRGYQGVLYSDIFYIYFGQNKYPIGFSYENNQGVEITCGEN